MPGLSATASSSAFLSASLPVVARGALPHPCMLHTIRGRTRLMHMLSHGKVVCQRWRFWSGRRFASCRRGGGRGKFRPAGGRRGQVAGSLPRRQPGTGTRQVRGGAVTPSLHPEVPGIQFVSPVHGLGIRQSMGWTKMCSTARSGIWVLKGDASTRMQCPG